MSDKRLSEDIQNDGFTICLCDDNHDVVGPMIEVTDGESTERLIDWFRHRPRGSNDFAASLFQDVDSQIPSGPFPRHFRIEAASLRVTIPIMADLVIVLETRAAPGDEWKKTLWKMRQEDVELKQWAMAEYSVRAVDQYKLLRDQSQLSGAEPWTNNDFSSQEHFSTSKSQADTFDGRN